MHVLRVGEQAIIFTLEEIQRLHDLFQNPIYDDETAEENEFRERMYAGFKTYLKNSKQELSSRQRAAPPIVEFDNYDDDIPF